MTGAEVQRPELMDTLARLVTAAAGGTGEMTIGLAGSGGFGKTTLAKLVVHQPEIRASFRDGIIWVTLGEGVAGPELAVRINDLVEVLTGAKPSLADPVLAGAALAEALGDRRMLLVIDDVWSAAQLEPLRAGGPGTLRLVTARLRDVFPERAAVVEVDAMADGEARQLVTAGLGPVPDAMVAGLLKATGRWPVLLSLVNGAARSDFRHGATAPQALADVLALLVKGGPTALDVYHPDDRAQAVAATMGVSLARLTAAERDRYFELAVFGRT